MKKIFYIVILLIFLVSILGVIGCKEKDLGKDDQSEENSLQVPLSNREENRADSAESVNELEEFQSEMELQLREDRNILERKIPFEEMNIEIILDASKDVLEQDDGEKRIHLIKDGLQSFFDGFSKDITIGIRIFGGQRKEDCHDTKLIVPVGEIDRKLIEDGLNELTPFGRRAISHSLREAIKDFIPFEGKRIVVLISSGLDDCEKEPWAIAEALARANNGLKIYTVGLVASKKEGEQKDNKRQDLLTKDAETDVAMGKKSTDKIFGSNIDSEVEDGKGGWEAVAEQLERIARVTGGEYFEIKDAKGLIKSLNRILNKERYNLIVKGFSSREDELVGETDSQRWGCQIFSEATAKKYFKKVSKLPAEFTLEPGKYNLSVWYDDFKKYVKDIQVSSEEITEISVDFATGVLCVKVLGFDGNELIDDTSSFDCQWNCEVYSSSEDSLKLKETCAFPALFVLKPGVYDIKIQYGRFSKWIEGVRIRKGRTRIKKINFGSKES